MNLKVAFVAALACTAATVAKADLVPYYQYGNNVASVQFGTRTKVEVQKPHYINGQQSDLYSVTQDIYNLRKQFSSNLADYLTSEAANYGAQISPGQLTGTWRANIQSISADKNVIQFSGLSYGANFSITEQKGPLSVTCSGRVSFNNINISVQYDVNTAAVDRASSVVDLHASQDISSCDSSISWIPGVGLLVDYVIEGFAERLLRDKVSDLSEIALSQVVGKVNDGLASMTKIFSADTPLWSGDPYAPKVREYLANNARYWLSGRSIALEMEPEPQTNVVLGGGGGDMFDGVDKSGTIFKLTFTENNSPVLILALQNNVHFGYTWVCSVSNPRKQCQPNY